MGLAQSVTPTAIVWTKNYHESRIGPARVERYLKYEHRTLQFPQEIHGRNGLVRTVIAEAYAR